VASGFQRQDISLPENKRGKKMKGLAVSILLAILEIGAISASSGEGLLTDGPQVPTSRKEDAGVQTEMLVDAERPEFADEHYPFVSANQEGRPA
jgi:hypothetical protein